MAKAKLLLTANPTFTATVQVPVPGGRSEPVEFTFRSKSKSAFKEFVEGLKDREDIDIVMDLACGWNLDDSFDRENVEKLVENYIGSARAVIETYLAQQTGARLGN